MYCIIGAGASGLAVARNFKARGIPFEVLEREADLGGLWNMATRTGVVYESTHLVSAKTSTAFEDFPMPPENFPEYPSHAVVLDYFRAYVRHFGLGEHLVFNAQVADVAADGRGGFNVLVKGEAAPRAYAGVVLANGHHCEPRIPIYPGNFTGEIMHSSAYRRVQQLRDKRVLVVGAGNSACDIVRDAAHGSGSRVLMSMRRGTWFVPKYLLGFPTGDVVSLVELLPVPRLVKRYLFQGSLWILQGPPARHGLPKPAHPIDGAHPTMSDDIPRLSSHGRLEIKPEITRYEGREVVFTDGSRSEVDLVVFATGYRITFPFLADGLALDSQGRSRFYLNTAHMSHDTLFAAGLVQANGSIWRLADYQGRLIANYIVAKARGAQLAAGFRARVEAGGDGMPKGRFVGSERHTLETNYFDYRRALLRANRAFWKVRNLALDGTKIVRNRATGQYEPNSKRVFELSAPGAPPAADARVHSAADA